MNFSRPLKIFDKEKYLVNKIAWKNHKFFLSKNKKYELARKYIGLSYLNKMNYDSLFDVKDKIVKDIKNISIFPKRINSTVLFSLNDIYKLYNYSQKFDEAIKKLKIVDWEAIDKQVAKDLLKSISFVFDIDKKANPISYAVYYHMQYIFWQTVVIGGMLTNKPLSAMLLSNSLTLFGRNPENITIEDKEIVKEITDTEVFKVTIKEITDKYGKETGEFDLRDKDKEGVLLSFEGGDLLYALHDATMYVKAKKNQDGTWNFKIEIDDVYDFTDFKNLKQYVDKEEAIFTDIFSTLLNNFGVVSSEYGVIKKFDVKIKFDLYNYVIK